MGEVLTGYAAILTALASLGGMVWQGVKTRAEVRQLRKANHRTVTAAVAKVEDVATELRPNHGSSTRDAIARIEASSARALELAQETQAETAQLRGDMTGMRQELRGDREATRAVRIDVTQLRGDVGSLRDALMAHLDKGWEAEPRPRGAA